MEAIDCRKIFSSAIKAISGYLPKNLVNNSENIIEDSEISKDDVSKIIKDSEEKCSIDEELRLLAKSANYAGPRIF